MYEYEDSINIKQIVCVVAICVRVIQQFLVFRGIKSASFHSYLFAHRLRSIHILSDASSHPNRIEHRNWQHFGIELVTEFAHFHSSSKFEASD